LSRRYIIKPEHETPQYIFTHDIDGNKMYFHDIISEGLEGGYESRYPLLVELLESEKYQVMACTMLVAWARPQGFEHLIAWAGGERQWQGGCHRINSADDTFMELADALETSFYWDRTEELDRLQKEALIALLRIFEQYYFDQSLALATGKCQAMDEDIIHEIKDAMDRAMAILSSDAKLNFELPLQVIYMVAPLSRKGDDETAARYAHDLVKLFAESERLMKELIQTLGGATGKHTAEVLKNVKSAVPKSLAELIDAVIERRKEKGTLQ
jgi:hypothetical protein